MNRKSAPQWLNLILAGALTAAAAGLLGQLLEMGVLPDEYVTLIGVGVACWEIVVFAIAGGASHGKRDILCAAVTVLLCAALVYANVLVLQLHSAMLSITAEEESADAAQETEEEAESADAQEEEIVELTDDESIFVIYISGIDDDGEIEDTVSRSDVNIIAVVNTLTGQIQLINTPRDYYVYLPSKGAYDKLTHAGLYGIDCSMETLEYLYDVEIDYYARINFTGFETLIDDIGGIDIYVAEDFVSNDGIAYYAGWMHMDGYYALNYARERKAFTTGDVQRGQNQMQVIEAIVDQMFSSGMVLTNFTSLLQDVTDMVQTNMRTSMIYDLIRYQLSSETDWEFGAYTVTGTSTRRSVYSVSTSVSVMIPDESTVEEAKALIQAALSGETDASGDASEETDADADGAEVSSETAADAASGY